MVEWHCQISEYEFEQILQDSERQRSLVCCSPQGCKKLDTTEQEHLPSETSSNTLLKTSARLFCSLFCFICCHSLYHLVHYLFIFFISVFLIRK